MQAISSQIEEEKLKCESQLKVFTDELRQVRDKIIKIRIILKTFIIKKMWIPLIIF